MAIDWDKFSNLTFVPRSEWGASQHRSRPVNDRTNDDDVLTHHAAGAMPSSDISAMRIVREIQHFHMNNRGWTDIAYNFLQWDRYIFEGRGIFGQNGANSPTNSRSLSLCLLGNRETHPVWPEERLAYIDFHRAIGSDAAVCPGDCDPGLHRDVSSTLCPGELAVRMQREIRADLVKALAGDLTDIVAPPPIVVPDLDMAGLRLAITDIEEARAHLNGAETRIKGFLAGN